MYRFRNKFRMTGIEQPLFFMSNESTFDLSRLLQNETSLSVKRQISYVWKLSVPSILAQISSILMQYIDAAMVGSLGPDASAAIGLVASSTWVLGSLSNALCVGFTVQVAHAFGAGEYQKAKFILSRSIFTCLTFASILALISLSISFKLPSWLGGSQAIQQDAFYYFLIYALSTPFFIIVYLMSGMLQCSGNMKVPGFLNGLMCFLDIGFNALFIFGCRMGVKGAALGTCCSAMVTAAIMSIYTLFASKLALFGKKRVQNLTLSTKNEYREGHFIRKAIKLAVPIGVESAAFTGALVAIAKIVAPLGSVALSANSFATTAEALCYMPGYGIQEAAITLVGQSVGARRKDLTKSFSIITIAMGMIVMSLMGVIMYFCCPFVMKFLSPDIDVQNLGVSVLRIELFAEPFYAASIVSIGCLRAKGDTLVPSILNLASLWIVRLVISLLLVKPMGLTGIWIAMTAELCFRGIIMLTRLFVFPKGGRAGL